LPVKDLPELFSRVDPLSLVPNLKISGLALDSRQVQPGDLFFAITGFNIDRHDFIPAALGKGASAVIGTRPAAEFPDLPYVQVEHGRYALAHIAADFYGRPADKLTLIGVTGTDGKTTTTNLIYHILKAAGHKVGMISTVNAVIGEEELDTGFHVTTPEAYDVQRYLAEMVAAGLTHAVLETTSHGLDQLRVIPEDFTIAVVTNITHEHLNDHGDSYENYRAAKARLFFGLREPYNRAEYRLKAAVLNADDPRSFDFLFNGVTVDKIVYGIGGDAGVRASQMRYSPRGLTFRAEGPGFDFTVDSHLIGAYNVSNILAAIGATVVGLGVAPGAAKAGIAALPGVPGRMEYIDLGQPFIAMVDFAHTPNSLKVTLEAAREIANGRVIAVFGSAGLRDRLKRRMMAETSAQYADITILTAEDPRTESLESILDEMAAGAESQGAVEGETYYRVADRGAAIRFALDLAQPGDIVLALGKGHEQSMCFGETEHLWDDRTAMGAALADYLGETGPQMPYLPTQDEDYAWSAA
jgi:UDP-N-acetylmuramoyl-L-alanyl-D-glutamate--2,6-diaminopimelate ligase